mmetsp:Transcript_25151/g.41176  ORF Transcript_25151/g.41176 Transcript_25151/m.41176 type:complete len:87 (+) Transcript_25151:306-566(+)
MAIIMLFLFRRRRRVYYALTCQGPHIITFPYITVAKVNLIVFCSFLFVICLRTILICTEPIAVYITCYIQWRWFGIHKSTNIAAAT